MVLCRGSKEEHARIGSVRVLRAWILSVSAHTDPTKVHEAANRSQDKSDSSISELTLRVLSSNIEEQLRGSFQGCDSILAIAPCSQDGKQWLAHTYHMGKCSSNQMPLIFMWALCLSWRCSNNAKTPSIPRPIGFGYRLLQSMYSDT